MIYYQTKARTDLLNGRRKIPIRLNHIERFGRRRSGKVSAKEILDNPFRFIYWWRLIFHATWWCPWGPTGKPVKFRYGPAAVFGDEIRNCHWSGTKQIGKARRVDWSESQKTCHYVHVCGDGKSSSGYAWGFFLSKPTVPFKFFKSSATKTRRHKKKKMKFGILSNREESIN